MNKLLKIIIWPILLAPAVYLAIIWNSLPETLPLQFDLEGNPSRFGKKSELWVVVIITTVISIGLYSFLPLVYKIDPKKTAADNKDRLKQLAFAIGVFMAFIGFVAVYAISHAGLKISMKLIFGSLGVFWCVLGNYMYNIKPNYFAGLRLPWTLQDEDNWKKTHWLTGKLWFAAGILIILVAIVLPEAAVLYTGIGIIMLSTIVPIVFSYKLYRKKITGGSE